MHNLSSVCELVYKPEAESISNINCMNYDHNKIFGLFKFQSGYRKFYLNSPKGYSRKIINAQTALHRVYQEYALAVLAERFAEGLEDPEVLHRVADWLEGTTPGLYEEEVGYITLIGYITLYSIAVVLLW